MGVGREEEEEIAELNVVVFGGSSRVTPGEVGGRSGGATRGASGRSEASRVRMNVERVTK